MEIKMLDPLEALGDPIDRNTGALKLKCEVCGRPAKIGSRLSCRKFMQLNGWRHCHKPVIIEGDHFAGWICKQCYEKNFKGDV